MIFRIWLSKNVRIAVIVFHPLRRETMLYSVTHTTTYHYTDPVSLCHNLVHLRPRSASRQTCHHSSMVVQPEPRVVQHHHDYFGNPIALFTIQELFSFPTVRGDTPATLTDTGQVRMGTVSPTFPPVRTR